MKRYISAILVLTAAVSCTKYIKFTPAQTAPTIVVNALMKADEKEHDIYVGISYVDMVTPVKADETEINLYIGDSPAIRAKHIKDNGISSAFRVAADFKPGDRVRMTVKSQEYAAEAETVVPGTAAIDRIDTLTMMIRETSDVGSSVNTWEAIRFTVNVVDRKNSDDRYMLMANIKSYVTDEFKDTVSALEVSRLELDNQLDPLLNGGATAGSEELNYTEYGNPDNIFSDKAFIDSSRGFKLLARKYDLFCWPEIEDYDSEDEYLVHREVVFYIYSIGTKEFDYRKSASILYANDYDMSFMEPVSLPGNIKGGIGIFGIAAADSLSLKLPDVKYLN